MLRRALLCAALLAPLAAGAQTTTASLTISPTGPLGKSDCVAPGDPNDPVVTFSWTVVPATTPAADSIYQIKALKSGTCASDTGTQLLNRATINWSSVNTGSYPGTSGDPTLHLSDLIAATTPGACSGGADVTITLCVQLVSAAAPATIETQVSNNLVVQLAPPPVPQGVSVAGGLNALNVAWRVGTSSTVTTDRYRVTASKVTCTPVPNPLTVACLGALAADETTSNTSFRLTGLENGVTYGVQVFAISTGGNVSNPTAPVAGVPIHVNDFWDTYTLDLAGAEGEQGGCAGGSAGLLSLLAVAGLLRAARRRS